MPFGGKPQNAWHITDFHRDEVQFFENEVAVRKHAILYQNPRTATYPSSCSDFKVFLKANEQPGLCIISFHECIIDKKQ